MKPTSVSSYTPKSTINLYGKHAFATKNMPLGVKKTISIKVQKSAHSIDSEDGTQSARFDIIGMPSTPKKSKQFNIYKGGNNG